MSSGVMEDKGKELCLEHVFSTGDRIHVRINHNPRYSQDEIKGMLEVAFMNILSELQ